MVMVGRLFMVLYPVRPSASVFRREETPRYEGRTTDRDTDNKKSLDLFVVHHSELDPRGRREARRPSPVANHDLDHVGLVVGGWWMV